MNLIRPEEVGPRCLEVLVRFGLYEERPNGETHPTKTIETWLTATLIRKNPPNLYVALTEAITKWCSDTDAHIMEQYIMIEMLARTVSCEVPDFHQRMMRDRAIIHAQQNLTDDDLRIALITMQAVTEQREAMK